MQPAFLIIILAWESEVEIDKVRIPVHILIHGGFAEALMTGFPYDLFSGVGQELRRIQMITVYSVDAVGILHLDRRVLVRQIGIALLLAARAAVFRHQVGAIPQIPGGGPVHGLVNAPTLGVVLITGRGAGTGVAVANQAVVVIVAESLAGAFCDGVAIVIEAVVGDAGGFEYPVIGVIVIQQGVTGVFPIAGLVVAKTLGRGEPQACRVGGAGQAVGVVIAVIVQPGGIRYCIDIADVVVGVDPLLQGSSTVLDGNSFYRSIGGVQAVHGEASGGDELFQAVVVVVREGAEGLATGECCTAQAVQCVAGVLVSIGPAAVDQCQGIAVAKPVIVVVQSEGTTGVQQHAGDIATVQGVVGVAVERCGTDGGVGHALDITGVVVLVADGAVDRGRDIVGVIFNIVDRAPDVIAVVDLLPPGVEPIVQAVAVIVDILEGLPERSDLCGQARQAVVGVAGRVRLAIGHRDQIIGGVIAKPGLDIGGDAQLVTLDQTTQVIVGEPSFIQVGVDDGDGAVGGVIAVLRDLEQWVGHGFAVTGGIIGKLPGVVLAIGPGEFAAFAVVSVGLDGNELSAVVLALDTGQAVFGIVIQLDELAFAVGDGSAYFDLLQAVVGVGVDRFFLQGVGLLC